MAITIDIEKAKKVANDAISKRKLVKDAIGKIYRTFFVHFTKLIDMF